MQWEGSVVGEGDQRIMVHPVEVEGTLGDAAEPAHSKQEGEVAHTVVVRVVLVSLVGTPMMLGLSRLSRYPPNKENIFFPFLSNQNVELIFKLNFFQQSKTHNG